MSLKLIVQPSAKRDLAEADVYYAQHGKADAFLAAIDQAFTHVALHALRQVSLQIGW